ncbi:hypothetical protein [Streptomyces sp. NPDC003877]
MLKYTAVSGSVPLDDCTSQDGSHRHLRSARLDFRLTDKASCTRLRDSQSVGIITWYGKKDHGGTPIGRPRLQTPAGVLGNPAHLEFGSRGISSLAGAFWAYARYNSA